MEMAIQLQEGRRREERVLTTPHPDIELGLKRGQLEYFLTYPEKGIDRDTGLVFCIPPWGDTADSPYQRDKLRPYLADRCNSVVCGINYFGMQPPSLNGYDLVPGPDFFEAIRLLYGIELARYAQEGGVSLERVAEILRTQGVRRVSSFCRILMKLKNGEYESFGFLPAVDHLSVCGEILGRFSLNTRKIVAFGSSYGGYIALLLSKYAPETFSAVIDNSGFVRPALHMFAGKGLLYYEKTLDLNGVQFPVVQDNLWRIDDERSPHYYCDSHRFIRSLLEGLIHRCISKFYIFHAEGDTVAPSAEKRAYVDMIRDRAKRVHAEFVRPEDLDGVRFKSMQHGMDASLRKIFDYACTLDGNGLTKAGPDTDFSLGRTRRFPCRGAAYLFRYGSDLKLNVSIETSDCERS